MPAFPKGARVCFIGDSITHHNQFVSRIVAYYHDNLPSLGVNFYNCGVSGGSAQSQYQYLEDDVFPRKPTHACIMLGVNDSGRDALAKPQSIERYTELSDRFILYKAKMERLCLALISRGVKVTLCTPVPYAEYQTEGNPPLPGGYALISGYAAFCRELCAKLHLDLCDYHAYFTEVMQSKILYGPDRIHPTELGHYYMAKCFLAHQGLTLGEKEPIPAYLDEWREKTGILRGLYAAEWMLVKNYGLPDDEKIAYMKTYLDKELYVGNHTELFRNYALMYLEHKPKQAELVKRIDEIMEVELKK